MPTLPIDENGTVLFFEDTGPPQNQSNYTTIVLIHGLIVHSGIFRRMIPYAAQANLRLILLNMRDYSGSSGYTQDELQALGSSDVDTQALAIKQQGVHLATFLVHFVQANDIFPKPGSSEAGTPGGLVVLTWSLGNVVAHSFLAHANDYPPSTKDLLERYLRTIVFYTVAATGIGQLPLPPPPPEGGPKVTTQRIYSPLRDPSIPPLERVRLFATWITSFFPPIDDLSGITPEAINSRKALHLKDNPFYDPARKPSVENMTPQELQSLADFDVLERSSGFLTRINSAVYLRNFQRAHWFDGSTSPEEKVWPGLKVLVLWCDMDMGDCIWAASRFHERLMDPDYAKNGGARRNIEMARFEGGNHFAHWGEPERFVKFLAARI